MCDSGNTIDGDVVKVKVNGVEEPTRFYHICKECDLTCKSCKGEKSPSTPGDKGRCTSCSIIFPYMVLEEEACYVSCSAGYYEARFPFFPNYGICGICKDPCNTCRKCKAGFEKNCDPNHPAPSENFCLSCN